MDESVRVLSVDDEPDFAETAAAFLEREDDRFEVATATAVDEALDRLADERFDCVVSDYEMPDRNGIEFLEAVREDYPDLPFILFTGKGSEEIASDAISAGVTDYLQKQPGGDQYTVLANRIANAVEHYRAQREVERGRQRLRRIVDALPHMVYVVDGEGTYLLANEALAGFHDAAVDDIEGAAVTAVLARSTADRIMDDVGTVLETDEPRRLDLMEIDDPQGETHVFEPRLLPYGLAESSDRAVLGVATDVTERVRRERELNALVERLEALHAATRTLVRAEDRDAVAQALTDAVRDIFEYARSVVRFHEDEELRPVEVTRPAREDLGERPVYADDEGLPGEAFHAGDPVVVQDFREHDDDIDRTPHRSAMYLPLGDHGTLTIGHREPAAFDRSDQWLVRVLANNAAAVLDRLEDRDDAV